jgi:flagellar operon protein (TIGR03826 family)
MTMDLANCPRCGKLFARHFRDVCQNCQKEIEQEYEICANYLRENKGATIQMLSEATGVSIKQITRFIKEGRISLLNAPNLTYPCEGCGFPIREGNLCDSCRTRLIHEVQSVQAASRTKERPDNETTGGAYRIGDRLRERQ